MFAAESTPIGNVYHCGEILVKSIFSLIHFFHPLFCACPTPGISGAGGSPFLWSQASAIDNSLHHWMICKLPRPDTFNPLQQISDNSHPLHKMQTCLATNAPSTSHGN
jgi:hypothetical protein